MSKACGNQTDVKGRGLIARLRKQGYSESELKPVQELLDHPEQGMFRSCRDMMAPLMGTILGDRTPAEFVHSGRQLLGRLKQSGRYSAGGLRGFEDLLTQVASEAFMTV